MNEDGSLIISNYAVCFVDLLGQKAQYEGEGILPSFSSAEDEQAFRLKVRKSIGAISKLQREATQFMEAAKPDMQSAKRLSLSKDDRAKWDNALQVNVRTQNWSDGLVYYSCLRDGAVCCSVSGIWNVLYAAGMHCLLGLADGRPLRGGIEIAWAAELCAGEIYGPAVVQAYKLESEAAKWPRIVVGEQLFAYLMANALSSESDTYSGINRSLAQQCIQLIRTVDGSRMIDFLCPAFASDLKDKAYVVKKASEFARLSLREFENKNSTKLTRYYTKLCAYFKESGVGL